MYVSVSVCLSVCLCMSIQEWARKTGRWSEGDPMLYYARVTVCMFLCLYVCLCMSIQEWARNTGRWSEGDPAPYFAQLKTRLRCAFNKAPDIEEMKDLHARNCEEPYKVYRFTTRKGPNFCSHRMHCKSTGKITFTYSFHWFLHMCVPWQCQKH